MCRPCTFEEIRRSRPSYGMSRRAPASSPPRSARRAGCRSRRRHLHVLRQAAFWCLTPRQDLARPSIPDSSFRIARQSGKLIATIGSNSTTRPASLPRVLLVVRKKETSPAAALTESALANALRKRLWRRQRKAAAAITPPMANSSHLTVANPTARNQLAKEHTKNKFPALLSMPITVNLRFTGLAFFSVFRIVFQSLLNVFAIANDNCASFNCVAGYIVGALDHAAQAACHS